VRLRGVVLFVAAWFAAAGCAAGQVAGDGQHVPIGGGGAIPARATRLPASASQGAMVIGNTHPAAIVEYAGRSLRVTPYGSFAFGVGRDATGEAVLRIRQPASDWIEHRIAIVPRDWPIERIDGVPPATVNPPKAIAERIAREQALVSAVRTRDDERVGFAQHFIRPVEGRVSGRFGNQRVYNGTPKSPHSGMDIAAPNGTQVKAPADGVISFANGDLYLTGGTVVLDHGHGISSNFLHLSRIEVKVGDAVKQGQVIGAVGATGRATGPHLHWGMNWFDVRIDPLLVLERGKSPSP
jgi:murein DD-endopeptidase MepM/ murein hydrolase activator NlpD